jgi:hypothetical protein
VKGSGQSQRRSRIVCLETEPHPNDVKIEKPKLFKNSFTKLNKLKTLPEFSMFSAITAYSFLKK